MIGSDPPSTMSLLGWLGSTTKENARSLSPIKSKAEAAKTERLVLGVLGTRSNSQEEAAIEEVAVDEIEDELAEAAIDAVDEIDGAEATDESAAGDA